MCQDQAISYLNAIGYNPISLPREGFDPLMILAGPNDQLRYLGGLADLVGAGEALPEPRRDDRAGNVSDRRSGKVEAGVGFDLVGKLLAAFGGTGAKASAGYDGSGSIEIVFQDVLHDYVAPLQVGAFLARSAPLEGSIAAMLQPYTNVYLVTDTLKSNAFGVAAYTKDGLAVNAKADAIANQVGANAKLQVTNEADNVISYQGDRWLRFAFRALPLVFQGGQRLRLGLDQNLLVAKAAPSTPSGQLPIDAYELLGPDRLVDVDFG